MLTLLFILLDLYEAKTISRLFKLFLPLVSGILLLFNE